MKNFYIVKTSFEMLDLATAYGLAWYLENIKKARKSIIIKDMGFYYFIEASEIDNSKIGLISGLVPKKEIQSDEIYPGLAIGLASVNKSERDKFLNEMSNFLERTVKKFELVLEKFSEPNVNKQIVSIFGNQEKNYHTLYGSIEPRGFKGERKVKKTISYSEGENYKVPFENLVLAVIGLSKFGFGKSNLLKLYKEWLLLLPAPDCNKGIEIKFLEEDIAAIKNKIKKVCFLSVLYTAALSVLYLEKEILTRKHELGIDGIIFNHLVGTRRKPKPYKDGRFPMDFFNNLFSLLGEKGFNALIDYWTILLEISEKKQLNELGNALSMFIFNPTLENYERYLKVHLHLYLNPKTNREFHFNNKKIGLYSEELIKAISKYVTYS